MTSVMTFKDGSDKYEIVAANGRFWLHATLVQRRLRKEIEPAAVRGIRVLRGNDNEDAALAICKAIVPE